MTEEVEHAIWWNVFQCVRRIAVFLLGCWVFIAALNDPESQNTITMLIIGAVMVGVLPIEDVFGRWSRRYREDK